MITNVQGKKMPKENASYNCTALVGIDCVIRMNKIFYPQTYLSECKYHIIKSRMENLINDDLELSSCDESDYESCGENESNDNEE